MLDKLPRDVLTVVFTFATFSELCRLCMPFLDLPTPRVCVHIITSFSRF
jgi:hypothetical protein